MLVAAAQLPGVRIHRESYLRSAFAKSCAPDQVEEAVRTSPSAAGIDASLIEKAASDSIRFETAKVSTLSAAAGLPGGIGIAAAVPADLAQYLAHMMRIAQKLAYLYGWPELFEGSGDDLDDGTHNILMLFFGVMFGTQVANAAVASVAKMIAEQAVRQLPKQALTKGAIYPLVKQVASLLGTQMTKQIFARGVGKVIPVIGAAVEGGITLATFPPMCKRLRVHLRGLDLGAARVA
ncbi:hypothetical protein [Serinibacter salmoneus]|uniref:EcsC family protein n=1 Tax=Serinibacter salmoneus TaxID=556530 RepID=A0A2A9CWN0_9MICO|nr:hypothetical protein [Serinibacter salmoneus]PFG18546.1 hypothetical protein ATL40_0086 [Serinibacter salmoneus]